MPQPWNQTEIQPGKIIKASHVEQAQDLWQGDVSAGGNILSDLDHLVLNEIAEPATPSAGTGIIFIDAAGVVKAKDDAGVVTTLSGETNTASNQGAGVGPFDGKVGADLQFRSFVAASTKLSIALDGPNKEIDFDVVEANVLLQNLGGQATAGQVPNLENLNGTLDIASGGTGNTTSIAAFNALSPVTTLGDIIYRDASNNVRLAGNTTTAKQFLTQTGDGVASAAPAWGTIVAGDLPSHTHDAQTDLTNLFYQTFEDEGIAVTQRANVNFTGAGVTVSDVGGKTTVTISGASSNAAGADTEIQFNDGGTQFGADPDFTWNKTTNLLTVKGATDGEQVNVVLENSQANAAASVNESSQLRFGFGGNLDVARIIAGKEADYTTGANEDSFLAFFTDLNGTVGERLRITSDGKVGINQTNPRELLHIDAGALGSGVQDALAIQYGGLVGDGAGFVFGNTQAAEHSRFYSITPDGGGNTDFVFELRGTERARLHSNNGMLDGVGFKAVTATSFVVSDGPKFYQQSNLGAVIQGVAGSTANFALATPGGAVLIENPAATSHLVFGSGSTTSLAIRTTTTLGDPLIVNIAADGDLVSFRSADIEEGKISVAGNTVTYGQFLGVHPTQFKTNINPPIGAVMISTGERIVSEATSWEFLKDKRGEFTPQELEQMTPEDIDRLNSEETDPTFSPRIAVVVQHKPPKDDATGKPDEKKVPKHWKRKDIPRNTAIEERFVYCEGTTTVADKRAYGVYVRQDEEDTYGMGFGKNSEPSHNIASVGLYVIRVTDTGGDISNGDYLCSSTRLWEAQKQTDDLLHSYTVAKALVDVDWSTEDVDVDLGYKWKLIPATIHCG